MPLPTVMFIRHAEKPEKSEKGVTHDGEHDEHSLSVRGWTRAGALAALFTNSDSRDLLQQPERIIATEPDHAYKSKREHDTALPTANRLGLDIEATTIPDDYATLTTSITGSGTPTLVVWHHGSIPAFISALPVSNTEEVPISWPEDRFDLIWVLHPEGSSYTWHQVKQELLEGDALG
jgi:hypothetical protein